MLKFDPIKAGMKSSSSCLVCSWCPSLIGKVVFKNFGTHYWRKRRLDIFKMGALCVVHVMALTTALSPHGSRRELRERRPLCAVCVSILRQWQLSVVQMCEFKRHGTERNVGVSSGPLCQCRTNILLCLNTHCRVPTLGSGTPRRSCDEFKANCMVLLVYLHAVHSSVEP